MIINVRFHRKFEYIYYYVKTFPTTINSLFFLDIFFSLQPSSHINEGIEIEDNEEIGMTCNECLPSCSAEVIIN